MSLSEEDLALAIRYLNEVLIPRGWDGRPRCFASVVRGFNQVTRCRANATTVCVAILAGQNVVPTRFEYDLLCAQHRKFGRGIDIRLTEYQIRVGAKNYKAQQVLAALVS